MRLTTLESKLFGRTLNRRNDGQISHGLNLVLKLNNAADMPQVLQFIAQKKRKIHAGLGELNFVHFARFLPTHDNTALQVITEFDGPLAPYVLDFAIEIGDVFDTLLGFTQGTAGIVPVAEHPAEFLAFVRANNTVTVPTTPPVPVEDWPLYAAYPEQTALDIMGARDDLPIPKGDRWVTPVDRADIQGNVLRGYRAEHVAHFVLGVVDAASARAWLANRATANAHGPAGTPKITPATNWGHKPDLMLNIGLTYCGMVALGIKAPWLVPFPEAFRQGPVQRAADNFDVDANAPANWWLGGPSQEKSIHVVLSLYHKGGAGAVFNTVAAALEASFPGAGFQLLARHDADYNNGNSWFGFVDGIANPRIAVASPVPGFKEDLQPAATAGEFVLGANYKNIYGGTSLGALPAALATNGTFCAVRVLAQDPLRFDSFLQDEAARLNVSPDWLAAKLMGRWYKGAPVSLYPDVQPPAPAADGRNDFDYAPSYEYPDTPTDQGGQRCPVGAHIRRANPRTSRVAGARYARRLMRRGMHYEIKDAYGTRVEVGLFGMFICADLERQFEFIQREWINGDRFTAGLRGTRDPIIGTAQGVDDEFEIPGPCGAPLKVRLPQFVHTRGSLYLFMPGLQALRDLNDFAKPKPIVPAAAAAHLARAPVAVLPSQGSDLARAFQGLQETLAKAGTKLIDAELFGIARACLGMSADDAQTSRSANHASSPRSLYLDPRRRDFQLNPYPLFAKFRAREPVHYSPVYKGWFVFGYDDVRRVCGNDAEFSAVPLGYTDPRGMFTLDIPEHTGVRRFVQDAWNQAAVNTHTFVQNSISSAIVSIGARRSFDLVDDFARPVPRDVYFDILGGSGIAAAERLELDELARKIMKFHDRTMDLAQQLEGLVAAVKLLDRLGKMLVLAANPKSPYRGTFLAYLAEKVDWYTGPFTPLIAALTLVNLTVAGYMSVEFLLATGIRRLLLDPHAGWDIVKADPGTFPDFLNEMRRTEHALSVVERYAKTDIVMNGVPIAKGALVLGVLASANRDHSFFGTDADEFKPGRPNAHQHLGLGYGTHECMGRALEKAISEPALGGLVKALPGLRLQSAAQPPWFENFYFRSFDHLAMTLN